MYQAGWGRVLVTCIVTCTIYYLALIFLYVSKQTLPPPIEDSAGTGQAESVYLAPHGVPGGIPRSPSKAKGTVLVTRRVLVNYS